MQTATTMTLDEKLDTALRSAELRKAGKEEEAHQLMNQIPIPPYLAKAIKEVFGAEYLKNSGQNLSEVETEYGKDWLNR
ncbi:hypothetical protein RsTz2092_04860 [Deferribacterales bacterium RsTz2092]